METNRLLPADIPSASFPFELTESYAYVASAWSSRDARRARKIVDAAGSNRVRCTAD
jgi:hypothetical protein